MSMDERESKRISVGSSPGASMVAWKFGRIGGMLIELHRSKKG